MAFQKWITKRRLIVHIDAVNHVAIRALLNFKHTQKKIIGILTKNRYVVKQQIYCFMYLNAQGWGRG